MDCLGYAQQSQGDNKVAKLVSIRNKQQHFEPSARTSKHSPKGQEHKRSIEVARQDSSSSSCTHRASCPEGLDSPSHEAKVGSEKPEDPPSTSDGNVALLPGFSSIPCTATILADRSEKEHSDYSMHYRKRVPYFRYFGPTAMVPGFKQMVVDLNHHPELEPINGAFIPQEDLKITANDPEGPSRRKSSPTSPSIPFYSRGDRSIRF